MRAAAAALTLMLAVAPGRAAAMPFAGVAAGDDLMFRMLYLAEVPAGLFGQPISEIRVEGNRRVETEAMMLELESGVGELVSARNLASDIRRLWAMGKFEDIRVQGEAAPEGVILTYLVKERPTVRKIVVEGNSKIKLDDINEVLDLKLNAILDLGAVKANVEKVKQAYVEKGFFLASSARSPSSATRRSPTTSFVNTCSPAWAATSASSRNALVASSTRRPLPVTSRCSRISTATRVTWTRASRTRSCR
jgi:outer membrane protein assembly factor BamA